LGLGERKRVTLDPLIEKIINSKNYKNNIRNIVELDEIEPKLIPLDFLDLTTRERLKKLGIEYFYEYQKEVYDSIKKRENVAIISPTASGKTIAFHLKRNFRKEDIITRWGGDKFLIIMTDIKEKEVKRKLKEVKRKIDEKLKKI